MNYQQSSVHTLQPEATNKTASKNSMKKLVLPWLSLAVVAVTLGIHQAHRLLSQDEDERFLNPEILSAFHKPLHPLDKSDYIGFGCATIGLMIAGGGGIGGGGILIPIYILILGFSPKYAIPLANVTVFGGAIANTILNAPKRHPLADRPLVDWDLLLVMEPLTIGGSLIGAFLNKLLPENLLVIMLVLLLGFTANNTLTKAMKMYKKESEAIAKEIASQSGAILSEKTKLLKDAKSDKEAAKMTNMEQGKAASSSGASSTEDAQILSKILEEETKTPMKNVWTLIATFVVVLFINLMKGGGAFPSPLGIECGSASFWISNVAMLGWTIFIAMIVRLYLIRRNATKEMVNYPFVEGDIKWDSKATIVYPGICTLAGFFAGMFGVGGGIVKGPLMLAMGVHPAVASATSACMILFTSSTATTSFVVFGLLTPDYAAFCFTLGFVATVGGQVGLHYLMRKFKRNSLIAFSIGAVVLLSAILMTIQSLVAMFTEESHGHSGGVCADGGGASA